MQGYRIPEDISLVSAVDHPSAAGCPDIPLSSLLVNLEPACEELVSLLLARIKNKHYRARTEIRIPVRMNVCSSLIRKNKKTDGSRRRFSFYIVIARNAFIHSFLIISCTRAVGCTPLAPKSAYPISIAPSRSVYQKPLVPSLTKASYGCKALLADSHFPQTHPRIEVFKIG